MKNLIFVASLAAFLGLGLPACGQNEIHIIDPSARLMAGNGVVYFTIDNREAQIDTMIAAHSDIGMAMLMTSAENAAGVMPRHGLPDGIAVATGAARDLAPAGDHVMLSGVAGTYKTDDTITLTCPSTIPAARRPARGQPNLMPNRPRFQARLGCMANQMPCRSRRCLVGQGVIAAGHLSQWFNGVVDDLGGSSGQRVPRPAGRCDDVGTRA